ncbi:MAG: hypothetical protein LQ338_004895 [Usnochroma carphineum]|nr:MAG: hypothetical protein LQ338_004895 [Usnochroma carphineum]
MHHNSLHSISLLLSLIATIQSGIAAPAPAPASTAAPQTYWPGWDHMEKLFVFGASYTSTGFNWLQPPPPSPANPLGNHNRGTTSSNGPNFVEYLTTTFNASRVQTYNFAYPGAQVDIRATANKHGGKDKGGNDMVHQVQNGFIPSYTSKLHKPYADWDGAKSLFISFFGINDVLAYFRSQQPTTTTTITDAIMSSYTAQLATLYDAGARNFLLLNAPPLDLAPYFTRGETASGVPNSRSSSEEALAKDRGNVKKTIADYNARFPSLVTSFQETHPGATVWWYDLHALFADMQARPHLATEYMENVGLPPLQNMTESCAYYTKYGKGDKRVDFLGEVDYRDERCGPSVGKYFWLNGLHVTWSVHKVVAGRIAEGLRGSLKGGRLE